MCERLASLDLSHLELAVASSPSNPVMETYDDESSGGEAGTLLRFARLLADFLYFFSCFKSAACYSLRHPGNSGGACDDCNNPDRSTQRSLQDARETSGLHPCSPFLRSSPSDSLSPDLSPSTPHARRCTFTVWKLSMDMVEKD